MNNKQHTIKEPVTVSGVGLHTGVQANMTFLPAKANFGIKFQRMDLEGQPMVDADVDNVVDLSRGTTIEQHGARINTVEHTLAALVGLEIDNVLIQLDGPEPPIMDGSARMFVEALQRVGAEEQNALRNFFEVRESIFYRDGSRDVEIAALPLDDYRVTVMIDYNSPVLGSQHASITDIKQFPKEIASCRTFCFLHELEMLYKNNLIKGGDLNNAIVVVDRVVEDHELDYLADLFNQPKVEVKKEGILNNVELRYKNEPARHKLLDLMGDLARPVLLGVALTVGALETLRVLAVQKSAPYADPGEELELRMLWVDGAAPPTRSISLPNSWAGSSATATSAGHRTGLPWLVPGIVPLPQAAIRGAPVL